QLGTTDGPVASALFREPEGLVYDGTGSLYIADTDNNTIRRIALASGTVTTVAGTAGVAGNADGTGAAATFNKPKMMALDDAGHLYIADSLNNSIRVMALADDSVTTRATFTVPAIGVAAEGTDVIATLADDTVVRIDASSAVTTLAGAANAGGLVDGAA